MTFIQRVQRAGCRVKRTKNGYLIFCPDGGTLTIHQTESDWRARRNTVARLRRHGVRV